MSRKSNPEPDSAGSPDSGRESPSPKELKAFALQLLSRREYGERELAARLARKWPGVSAADERINGCVTQLSEQGLVSDQRFAEAFVRSRRSRGQGPVKIRAALRQRQVDSSAIADSLDESEDAWTRLALEWLERQAPEDLDLATRAKYYRRLMSRGFSHAQALGAIDRYARRLAGDARGRP